MDGAAEVIDSVKAAAGNRIFIGHVVAVVGEFFAGRESRRLADDLVAFDDHLAAVAVLDDPFAAQERDGVFRAVADAHKIDERVGFIRGQAATTMMVAQFIEAGGKPGEFE